MIIEKKNSSTSSFEQRTSFFILMMQHTETILVLDFGSQYTQLIGRRVREVGVYSEIHPFSFSLDKIRAMKPAGIILSGGPSSVYEDDAPKPDFAIFDIGIPILGICYGLQLISEKFHGKVDAAARGNTARRICR